MIKYQKIETVFERDTLGTKKLIEGKFRNPLVEYLKDCEWIFTEKIDGTNVRVYWDGYTFSFAGRTDNAILPKHLQQRLEELFCNDETEQLMEQLFQDKEVIIFGEGYGHKIQNGSIDYMDDRVDFIAFDVMINGIYTDRLNAEDICNKLGIKIVEVLLCASLQVAVDVVKSDLELSGIIANKEIEGLVGMPTVPIYDKQGNRIVVKIKKKDFMR